MRLFTHIVLSTTLGVSQFTKWSKLKVFGNAPLAIRVVKNENTGAVVGWWLGASQGAPGRVPVNRASQYISLRKAAMISGWHIQKMTAMLCSKGSPLNWSLTQTIAYHSRLFFCIEQVILQPFRWKKLQASHLRDLFFVGSLHQFWVDSHQHSKSSAIFSLPSWRAKTPTRKAYPAYPAKERTFLVAPSGFLCNAFSGG